MSDDKVRPPSEAGLAAIKARADAARRYIIGGCALDWEDEEDGPRTYSVVDEVQTVCVMILDGREDRRAVGDFLAESFQDVPALLAAVEERDHLIWVMSQDQEAYRRGVEEGLRRALEATVGWAAEYDTPYHNVMFAQGRKAGHRDMVEYVRRLGVDNSPPLPPDRARAEAERLREALRQIAGLEARGATMAEMLGGMRRIAREALGETP